MHIPCLSVVATLALAVSTVHADVYFEITLSGQLPDGLTDTVPAFSPTTFDVYVWGSGADTSLSYAVFALAGSAANHFTMMSLGVADPLDLFASQSSGSLDQLPGAIVGITVGTSTPVPLPTTMDSALMIYQGFVAQPEGWQVVMLPLPFGLITNAGTESNTHHFGITSTPVPTPGASFLLASSLLTVTTPRRRRPTRLTRLTVI